MKQLIRKKVKAGSLYYAIMVCVLVGICCASFLLVNHYTQMHSLMIATQTELLTTNDSAKNYFLGKVGEQEEEYDEVDLFDSGIRSYGSSYRWGFYKILKVSSLFRKDTVVQHVLLGKKNDSETALYLTDNNKPLHMVGKAKILGDAYLPKKGIKKGYITSQSYNSFTFLYGSKHISKNKLPKLDNAFGFPDINGMEVVYMEDNSVEESWYNSFQDKTIMIQVVGSFFANKTIQGNIIISSKDSLFIKKENLLNDVLILAPKVVFEEGFEGVVQVRAEEKVELQKETVLRYPSGIFLKSREIVVGKIILHAKSRFIGNIAMTGNKSVKSHQNLIEIREKAEIVGHVYCDGKTQLEGKIIGTLVTENFYLKTKASFYDNYIENGILDNKSFPNFFLGDDFLPTIESETHGYGVIKSL